MNGNGLSGSGDILEAGRKIFVVGDSTVCDYSDCPDEDYYLPRCGYGTQLYNYLNLTDKSQIVNLALAGRSSLSFLKEENYQRLKNAIGAGDFLIIGFGHNDEKDWDKERFTDPAADYRTPTTEKAPSFQYTLYENYIKLAKSCGAIPVLCTPITRYNPEGVYERLTFMHVTADGDYPSAILKLAAETHTAVVDLTRITGAFYAAHGDEAKKFHAFEMCKDGAPDGMDKTHINKYGAKQIAYWLATNLPADCPLSRYVKKECKPVCEKDYADAINKNFANEIKG